MPAQTVSAPVILRRLARFLPSRRSIAVGVGIAALGVGAYLIARETSIFAIDRVDVTGGSSAVDKQVAKALEPFVGRSLVGLDGGAVLQRVEALPTVVSASYDRSFPSTLHVMIVPERPIAVLRTGAAAWVVSARGRVIQPIVTTAESTLPRIWIGKKTLHPGDVLPRRLGGTSALALGAAGSFRSRVGTASFLDGVLVFHLRSGLELVLGSPSDIALKVAVAQAVLRRLPAGNTVIDVSAPSRPVTSIQ